MYSVKIITSGIITKDMFCRPLQLEYTGQSDCIITVRTYSGTPINNMKWLPVCDFLGDFWLGKTIEDFENEQGTNKYNPIIPIEWVKGKIPESHILKKVVKNGKEFWE